MNGQKYGVCVCVCDVDCVAYDGAADLARDVFGINQKL